MRAPATPDGYVAFLCGGARAVARADVVDAVQNALGSMTLHEHACRRADRVLHGRAPTFAFALRDDVRVVVRHNTHGGALARFTGDRFLAPTRAPLELATSLRLIAAGVPTPAVVAIVRYPAGGPFERADVATAEVPSAMDLAHVLVHEPTLHEQAARATAELLRALAAAGARHADLNIKNVLLQPVGDSLRAWVLDVDRVTFHTAGSTEVRLRNWARFTRSARKWRDRFGAPISEAWLQSIAASRR